MVTPNSMRTAASQPLLDGRGRQTFSEALDPSGYMHRLNIEKAEVSSARTN